jgi:hypothetical protein
VKLSLLIAVLCLWAFPVIAQAKQAACAETHQMCALECRARIFASDPRQQVCMQRCSATAAHCVRTGRSESPENRTQAGFGGRSARATPGPIAARRGYTKAPKRQEKPRSTPSSEAGF